MEQVLEFMSRTLLSIQETQLCQQKSLHELTVESIEILKQKGLINSIPNEQSVLQVTKLGKATYKGETLSTMVWHVCCTLVQLEFYLSYILGRRILVTGGIFNI